MHFVLACKTSYFFETEIILALYNPVVISITKLCVREPSIVFLGSLQEALFIFILSVGDLYLWLPLGYCLPLGTPRTFLLCFTLMNPVVFGVGHNSFGEISERE